MNEVFLDQSKILPFPKVTPIRLPKIIDMANNYFRQQTIAYNLDYNTQDLLVLEDCFRKWFEPLISLQGFDNVYFLNHGISQGLEILGHLHKNDKIKMILGDYHWLKTIGCAEEEKNKIQCSISYSSCPSSIDGSVFDNQWASDIHILDGAYIGSSLKQTVIPPNTKYILLGFSKNLGLLEFRCGLLISKEKISILETFQKKFLHLGLPNFKIIAKICDNVGIVELAQELKYYQEKFCSTFQDLNLIPSDSSLIATSSDIRYKFYRRRNGVIRVPLGESISRLINNNLW